MKDYLWVKQTKTKVKHFQLCSTFFYKSISTYLENRSCPLVTLLLPARTGSLTIKRSTKTRIIYRTLTARSGSTASKLKARSWQRWWLDRRLPFFYTLSFRTSPETTQWDSVPEQTRTQPIPPLQNLKSWRQFWHQIDRPTDSWNSGRQISVHLCRWTSCGKERQAHNRECLNSGAGLVRKVLPHPIASKSQRNHEWARNITFAKLAREVIGFWCGVCRVCRSCHYESRTLMGCPKSFCFVRPFWKDFFPPNASITPQPTRLIIIDKMS